jgi:DNA-binding IclR family transcriptional regulator
MPRKADKNKLQKAITLFHRQPGQKSGTYARKLGMHKEAFNRLLVQLNDKNILLYEDDKGRIWPFK